MSQGKWRTSYGGYALAIILISIAIDGILVSTGYADPLVLICIPLLSLGIYTMVFSAFASDWKYYLAWGVIISSIGVSLILVPVTGNLMLNFSIVLIIIVIIVVIVSKKKS
jgi:hypothetical protein